MTTSTSVGRRRLVACRALLAFSTALCSGLAAPAAAQLVAPAPLRQSIDANGVDLFAGTMTLDAPALTIGQDDPQGLSYYRLNRGAGWTDNMTAAMNLSGSVVTVSLGGVSDQFTVSGGSYTPVQANGATLVLSGSTYIYTRSDGTVVSFGKGKATPAPYYASEGRVTEIVRPSGARLRFGYATATYCATSKPGGTGDICTGHGNAYRLSTVQNGHGYQLAFSYDPNVTIDPDATAPDLAGWSAVRGVTVGNLEAAGAGASESFATAGDGTFSVGDALGRVTSYRMAGGAVLGITRPGSAAEDVTVGYASGRVTSVVTPAGSWSYAAADAGGVRTVVVTDPSSQQTSYAFDLASTLMTGMTDALQHRTSWSYYPSGLLKRVTAPEGNAVEYGYDGRGNVTSTVLHDKSGAASADITLTASYPASCASAATCNRPVSTTDALGRTTDYGYDPVHGGVTSVTGPAAVAGGVRPQLRYGYAAYADYFGQTMYKPTGSSMCVTGASCAGTADEVKTTVGYGTLAGNNLLPVTRTTGSGDGGLGAGVTIGYDARGNVTSVDGPLAGSADTTSYRWDAAREQVGAVSPDPDGPGPLKRRAVRTSYTPHGLASLVEAGTVTGTDDTAWAQFAAFAQVQTGYDAANRVAAQVLRAGGTSYATSQYSYDVANRRSCAAVRMNPGAWGTLPASACTAQAAGPAGPDRIVQVQYDEIGRAAQVTRGLGVASVASSETASYTADGRLATLGDGNGNVTAYAYDGQDRAYRTCFRTASVAACAAMPADYEQLGHDVAGNVTSRRLRDGTSIAYSYDRLDRPVTTHPSNGEADTGYGYDLLGRPVSAVRGGQALSFGYDALGRLLTQGSALGTMASQYDLAGRRTRLGWPDGFYVTYDYLVTGEPVSVRENGAASGLGMLAVFGYDDRGNRTSLTRGNGTSASYAADAVSRLASLGDDLPGSAYDRTTSFAYNPASQLASVTRSNDGYAYNGHYNHSDTTTINGLNQATASGGTSIAYDARGNVTAIVADGYGYSLENLLTSGPRGTTLGYDPIGRLSQLSQAGTTRFGYDGSDLTAEYDAAGTLQRRYVYAPGGEPLVWYEGGGTGDRRWLHADERGSIVAVSDGAGRVLGTNSYDEYGQPAPTNLGRIGYTGQAWLPELNLWYYKARMYAPGLGRFLQTDPIGYGDGLGWYGYVGGDPVNFTDPSGRDLSHWDWKCYGNCGPGYSNDSQNGMWQGTDEITYHSNGDGTTTASGIETLTWISYNSQTLSLGYSDYNFAPMAYEGLGFTNQGLNESQQNNQTHTCPKGSRVTASIGGSATGAFLYVAVSVGAEVGVSLPTNFFSTGSLRGLQFYGSVSFQGLGGLGFFAGAGATPSVGYSNGPIQSGASGSHVVGGGAALGVGGEASVATNGSGGSVSGGPEAGVGAYAGYGGKVSGTAATPQIGCTP